MKKRLRNWQCYWNNIGKHLIHRFFLKNMLSVVVNVNQHLILITPLADGQPADFLLFKSGSPFIETKLVKARVKFL
jgi:hypothetical protein